MKKKTAAKSARARMTKRKSLLTRAADSVKLVRELGNFLRYEDSEEIRPKPVGRRVKRSM